jgi:IS5 family transposase
VIEARRRPRRFAEVFITEHVDEFWDDWMRVIDQVLDDDDLVATVSDALSKVYAKRPSDSALLVPAIAVHQERLGRVPHLAAAAAGFYSAEGETTAKAMGVKRVSVPNRATKSAQRKQEQKKRWFKKAQNWRTGCEGRISLLKRRHGLNRCRYRGEAGMHRWVGLGVIGDNLINLGMALARSKTPP